MAGMIASPTVRWLVLLLLAAGCGGASEARVELSGFDVPAGGAVTLCRSLTLDTPAAFLTSIAWQANPGADHSELFYSAQPIDDAVWPCGEAIDWSQFSLIAEATGSSASWTLPAGVALRLPARPPMLLRTRFAAPAPSGGQVSARLRYTTQLVDRQAASVFVAIHAIQVPPHGDAQVTRRCTFSRDAQLLALSGYYHHHLTQFTVTSLRDGATLLSSSDAERPPFLQLDAGPTMQPGDALEVACSYHNDGDTPILYGPDLDADEHCNLFFYYQADRPTLYCTESSGSW
jgi:hypothetical protein